MNIGTGVLTRGTEDGESTYKKAHNATNKLSGANTSALEGNVRRDDKANPGVSTYYYKNPRQIRRLKYLELNFNEKHY